MSMSELGDGRACGSCDAPVVVTLDEHGLKARGVATFPLVLTSETVAGDALWPCAGNAELVALELAAFGAVQESFITPAHTNVGQSMNARLARWANDGAKCTSPAASICSTAKWVKGCSTGGGQVIA